MTITRYNKNNYSQISSLQLYSNYIKCLLSTKRSCPQNGPTPIILMPPLSVSAFTFPAICARFEKSERNPTNIYESSEYFLADPKNPTNCRECHESAK